MNEVFVVFADSGSAPEAECVYSIWATEDQAFLEIRRLTEADIPVGCYSDSRLHVARVRLDSPSNEWISIHTPRCAAEDNDE